LRGIGLHGNRAGQGAYFQFDIDDKLGIDRQLDIGQQEFLESRRLS
jgi:hypothetical protein